MITKDQLTQPNPPRVFTHTATGAKWRRNGQCKTWKTRPEQFCQPVKHGLCGYGYITEQNAAEFTAQ